MHMLAIGLIAVEIKLLFLISNVFITICILYYLNFPLCVKKSFK